MAESTLVSDKTAAARLPAAEKEALYGAVRERLDAVLEGEEDLLAAMTSVVCLLHNAVPYYSWTGFYRRVSEDELLVGPYQGTLGCLRIPFSRGVCGAAAREARTHLVPDVHAFPGHIACDAASRSEVVVPVFDAAGEVMAVLDVDSTLEGAFDEVDARRLEEIVATLARMRPGAVVWR